MTEKLLTIAIPSYNRHVILNQELRKYVRTLPPWVDIIIRDNCSEPPIAIDADILKAGEEIGIGIVVHRNKTNIGAAANILAVLGDVETTWAFLCGDDDTIDGRVLHGLKDILKEKEHWAFIKFSDASYEQKVRTVGNSAFDLLSQNFPSLLFMSTYLFNMTRVRKYFFYGYLTILAGGAHLGLAISAAASGEEFCLMPEVLATNGDAIDAWSPLDLKFNFFYLTELPLRPDDREALRRNIYSYYSLMREFIDLVSVFQIPEARDEAFYIRRKAIVTHMTRGHGTKRIAGMALAFVSRYVGPRGFEWLKRAYHRRKGAPYSHQFKSRFYRI